MNNTKKIILNASFFIVLFIITYALIFKDKNIDVLMYNLKDLKIIFLVIGIIMTTIYFSIEAYNTKKILESFNHKLSMINSLKFTMIGFFFSSITPASSGGQPMQIYYMSKEKINVSHSTMALLINLCAYNINTVFLGLFCATLNPNIVSGRLLFLFLLGALFNTISLTILLIGIFNNKLALKLVDFFLLVLKKFRYKKIELLKEKTYKELEIYNESANYIKENKGTFFKAIIRAFLQLIVYHSLPYFTYRALGLNSVNIVEFIIIQSILHCTVASLPLPGTIGVNESVFLILYGGIFGELLLTDALIIHRFISFYLFVIISLTVLIINVISLNKKNRHT